MTRNDRAGGDASQARLLALYEALDRLEELLEDMAELQVRSLEEAEARILQLNAEIDELEQQGSNQ